MRLLLFLVVLSTLLLPVLAGCAEEAPEGEAHKVVEDYLKAKVASDQEKLISLSCKEKEAQALQDALSFKSVDAELRDMACKENGKDGKYTLVTCQGTIAAEYDGEQREQDLSDVTYRALKEDGEWKMCGEQ